MSPTIGVLAIQGDVREHINHINALDVVARPVKTRADLQNLHGLIIPGGESTTMSILAKRNDLFPMLRKLSNEIPMFGSCAGLIMLANTVTDGREDQETIGGINIVAQRNAFGRQVDSFEIDLDIRQIGEPVFPAVFIRAPLVSAVGEGVEVLATIPAETFADEHDRVVAVRQGNLMATSFHPEITNDFRIHQYFVEMVKAA